MPTVPRNEKRVTPNEDATSSSSEGEKEELDEREQLLSSSFFPLPTVEETREERAQAEADSLDELDHERELLTQLQRLHKKLAKVRARTMSAPESTRVPVTSSPAVGASSSSSSSSRDDTETEDDNPYQKPKCPRFVGEGNKIIVCAAKKPVRMSKSRQGDAWAYRASQSAFKSSIDFMRETNRVQWVGWPGAVVDPGTQDAVRKRLEAEYACSPIFLAREQVVRLDGFCWKSLWPTLHCIPTDFNEQLHQDLFMTQFEAFEYFNGLFADRVSELYAEGDLVLVYDYELMLLPALLRKRLPDVACGFFLNAPFPSSELFQELPVRSQLLLGMLGADLIAFNNFDYVRHFQNACTRILGLEAYPTFELGRHCSFDFEGRLIALEICPAGIDPNRFAVPPPSSSSSDNQQQQQQPPPGTASSPHAPAAPSPQQPPQSSKPPSPNRPRVDLSRGTSAAGGFEDAKEGSPSSSPKAPSEATTHAVAATTMAVAGGGGGGAGMLLQPIAGSALKNPDLVYALVKRLNSQLQRDGGKLILSLDRLDWCKGLPQKLTAMEVFFTDFPQWRGKVTFFLVVRDHPGHRDVELLQMVSRLVGRVNGKFGSSDYVPVHYMHRTLLPEEISALYALADVALMSSTREGINLSAMEFVACQANVDTSDLHSLVCPREKGVLVYSEMAGCASSFKGALLVNPYDAAQVGAALNTALTMRGQAKDVRHHRLKTYVFEYTSEKWARRIGNALSEAQRGKRLTQHGSHGHLHGLGMAGMGLGCGGGAGGGGGGGGGSCGGGMGGSSGAYNNYSSWSSGMGAMAGGGGQESRQGTCKLDVSHLRSCYERAARRLVVLDYDGCLMAHQPLAQLSAPSEAVRQVLRALCDDPNNTVIVVTGRRRDDASDWFRDLPRLGIVADHGFWIRPPALPLDVASSSFSSSSFSSSSSAVKATRAGERSLSRKSSNHLSTNSLPPPSNSGGGGGGGCAMAVPFSSMPSLVKADGGGGGGGEASRSAQSSPRTSPRQKGAAGTAAAGAGGGVMEVEGEEGVQQLKPAACGRSVGGCDGVDGGVVRPRTPPVGRALSSVGRTLSVGSAGSAGSDGYGQLTHLDSSHSEPPLDNHDRPYSAATTGGEPIRGGGEVRARRVDSAPPDGLLDGLLGLGVRRQQEAHDHARALLLAEQQGDGAEEGTAQQQQQQQQQTLSPQELAVPLPAPCEWRPLDYCDAIDLSWVSEVRPILEDFTQRTPGSQLEQSECCLTWHYRDADADFGDSQAKALQLHFDQMLRRRPVRVSTAVTYKFILVQPVRVTKGRALMHFLTRVLPEQQLATATAQHRDRLHSTASVVEQAPLPPLLASAATAAAAAASAVATPTGYTPLLQTQFDQQFAAATGGGASAKQTSCPGGSPRLRSPLQRKNSGMGAAEAAAVAAVAAAMGGAGGGLGSFGAPPPLSLGPQALRIDERSLASSSTSSKAKPTVPPLLSSSFSSSPLPPSPHTFSSSHSPAPPPLPSPSLSSSSSASSMTSVTSAVTPRFEMVLCMSDDRTHEDLPSVWRGRLHGLSELAHGLFTVTSASGVKASKARWSVEDSGEVLLVLKALAEVSNNTGGGSDRSGGMTASSSLSSFASGSLSNSVRVGIV